MNEPVVSKADVLAEIQRLLRELDIDDAELSADNETPESSEPRVWREKTNVYLWQRE